MRLTLHSRSMMRVGSSENSSFHVVKLGGDIGSIQLVGAAKVIGRNTRYDRGALALRRDGAGFVIDSARPQNYDRPWAPDWHARTAEFSDAATNAARNPAPRDATPTLDDIEADQ